MKINEIKKEKQENLLQAAYELFIEKGVINTSVADITKKANIAKGTFYLYFKDKYELRDILIARQSAKLFKDAFKKLQKSDIKKFDDQVIFVLDNIINQFIKKPILREFIAKNLSFGVYNKRFSSLLKIVDETEYNVMDLFIEGVKNSGLKLEHPEVTLYMIIELASSTCYNSIKDKNPLPIEEFKPYLYNEIRKMLKA